MICCSTSCERSGKCGKYIYNLSAKYRDGYHTVEHLASFGWGSISSDGCESHYVCGANGNYAMYEPIDMERQINSSCGHCWFCYNGQCNYHGKCDYTKKWSNVLQNFVPTTYIEPETNSNDYSVLK